MKRVLTLATGLVLLLVCVGTVSAGTGLNLVENGGFESPVIAGPAAHYFGSGELSGWAVSNGGVDLYKNTFWTPHSGEQSLDLSARTPGKISQTINTANLDGTYTLSFWLAGNPFYDDTHAQGIKVFKVYWDGNEVTPTTGSLFFDTTGRSYTDMGWTPVTISGLKATKETTELVFEQGATDDPRCGVALDDISVVDPPVDPPVTPAPEFPSAALPASMLVGFMGIVLYVQKSRQE
jgi:hypothetical protein